METLNFLRKTNRNDTGHPGLIYVHHWGTGYQQLVFASKEAANIFKEKLNTPAYLEYLKQPA